MSNCESKTTQERGEDGGGGRGTGKDEEMQRQGRRGKKGVAAFAKLAATSVNDSSRRLADNFSRNKEKLVC